MSHPTPCQRRAFLLDVPSTRSRCPATVGWNSRRRIPTFEKVNPVAVLERRMPPPSLGNRRKRLRRFQPTTLNRCPATVGWNSRRRIPTFEKVNTVVVLERRMPPPSLGNRRKRLRRFHHTKSDPPHRDAQPPQVGIAEGVFRHCVYRNRRVDSPCWAPGTTSSGSPAQSAGYSPARTSR